MSVAVMILCPSQPGLSGDPAWASPHAREAQAPATVPSMPSSLVLRCANWDVIKFLIEELQHRGQNRGRQCLSPAAQSQPALSKVSPALSSGPPSLGLGQKRETKCSPSPQSREKVLRSRKSPTASSSILQNLPCPPRGAIAPHPGSRSLAHSGRSAFLEKLDWQFRAVSFPSLVQTDHKCPAGKGD